MIPDRVRISGQAPQLDKGGGWERALPPLRMHLAAADYGGNGGRVSRHRTHP